jgi:DNA polymerase-1
LTTLLFDADLLIYNSAFYAEVATETKDGYWTWHCKFQEVVDSFDYRLNNYMTLLNATDYKLFLSDENNFRKEVYPQYKILRQRKRRPLVLRAFKDYLIEERNALSVRNLEGDDLCGIYATNGTIEDPVIISEDKDLKTIPGYLFKGNEVKWYSKEEADYWHLYQTLVGDQTDGYPGAKGIGPKKAEDALKKAPTWQTVVSLFESVDMTEEDALVQARCARILRAEDWDEEKQEVKLWTPTQTDYSE